MLFLLYHQLELTTVFISVFLKTEEDAWTTITWHGIFEKFLDTIEQFSCYALEEGQGTEVEHKQRESM